MLAYHSPGATAAPIATSTSPVCPKCGVRNSGQRSCCVFGGSWFNNCGNGEKFDHTWAEGSRACETSVVTTAPVGAKSPHHETSFAYHQHTPPQQSRGRGSSVDNVYDSRATNDRPHDEFTKTTIFASFVIITLCV